MPRKILSIDDDPSINILLGKYLKEASFEHKSCLNIKEFITEFKNFKPDICIIDLNLDDKIGAGYEILKVIKKSSNSHMPVLILSKMSTLKDISYAMELGASDFLSKPLDKTTLLHKLKGIVGEEKSDRPLFEVSKQNQKCTFDMKMSIYEVSEYGLKIFSPFHISIGTLIKLKGEKFKKICGVTELSVTVVKSERSADKDCYLLNIDFPTEKREISHNVRSWLSENSRKVEL